MNTITNPTGSELRAPSARAHRLSAFLRSRTLFYAGAAAVTFVFWWSGVTKLWDFAGAQAEMTQFGLNPPAFFALATIALQLGGSALVIFGGRYAWLGAGLLAVFTLATIPLAHHFWNMNGDVAFLEKTIAQEHIALIGGLVLAAMLADLRSEHPL
jgi:transmembrane protein